MSAVDFRMPDAEFGIIWRYVDGVSQALARRFEGGSSPGEENLTFLLCELFDEGTTSRHLLEYPLNKAKEDLARADGGITLDVSFQTHEHTKYVEHHYSGADLGVVFVVKHPYFGRSERAVLLQAKRLFPNSSREYTLKSSFSSFHADQRDKLKNVEDQFSASHSVFYLWYAPSSNAFSEDESKLIRSLEATATWDSHGWHPFLDEMLRFGFPWHEWRRASRTVTPEHDDRERAWRVAQPATRVSSLSIVGELTSRGHGPRLISLYQARSGRQRRWDWPAFEPLADLFLAGMLSDDIGASSEDWLRLARGEKVAMPPVTEPEKRTAEIPEIVPTPRHTLTFTLGSSLRWSDDLLQPE